MEHQNDYTLDVPLYPVRAYALLVIVPVLFLFVEGMLDNGFDGETLLAGAVTLAIALGTAALTSWCMRKYRFRVDAEGIRINRLRGRIDQLRWQDVRTAAIVHLDEDKWIVLSTLEPQEVLVRQRLETPQQNDRATIHLSANDRNLRLAEHHLHMTLPDVHLDKKRKDK